MTKRKTTEEFISEARRIHGNKYDYSKVKYINGKSKVCIICPEHGEFWQIPNNHLRGMGCSKCGQLSLRNQFKLTKDQFVKKSHQIHGDKYDYSKVDYINNRHKVEIICPIHGSFWQTPVDHFSGCGCPKCAREKATNAQRDTLQDFISKAKQIHGDEYDYSKTKYLNSHTKICIIHKNCGKEFFQTPNSHLNGSGCPYCKGEKISENKKSDTYDFITKAKKIHNDKYDYTLVKYITAKIPVKIICKKHGVFEQTPDKHLYGRGCPKCGQQLSNAENDILNFIQKYNECQQRCRNIVHPYELDIYIPDKKVAIEYDGLRWHSELFREDKYYHLNKTELCEGQGIQLIHIFEDEWLQHEDIVKSKIKHILGYDNEQPKIYARKCAISEIDNMVAKSFLEINHIQGFTRSSIYLGCYFNEALVGIMSFKKDRKDNDNWELTRFVTDINRRCIGVGSKLFKYFVDHFHPKKVKSFADRRWSNTLRENLYTKLGFKVDKVLKPDYHYVVGGSRLHKFNFRKQILHKKYGLPLSMTENEMTQKLGFYRIYDCGLIKYIWNDN